MSPLRHPVNIFFNFFSKLVSVVPKPGCDALLCFSKNFSPKREAASTQLRCRRQAVFENFFSGNPFAAISGFKLSPDPLIYKGDRNIRGEKELSPPQRGRVYLRKTNPPVNHFLKFFRFFIATMYIIYTFLSDKAASLSCVSHVP